jgi:1-acyl-sn-glycerol-3-phosphate acyltransferase
MLYRLYWLILVPLIRVVWRQKVTGQRHVPKRGGFILASNHQSGVDIMVLCASFWRQIFYLAKVEYVITPKVAWFFKSVSVIPVNRDAPEGESLEKAADCVRSGRIFGIFPEGTRSPDGRIFRGYTGVARVAMMTGAPVIPAACIGTRESLPKGRLLPKLIRCEVRFGAPMRFAMLPGEDEKVALRRFTDEVMAAIAGLAGKEYVDLYSRDYLRDPAHPDAGG